MGRFKILREYIRNILSENFIVKEEVKDPPKPISLKRSRIMKKSKYGHRKRS